MQLGTSSFWFRDGLSRRMLPSLVGRRRLFLEYVAFLEADKQQTTEYYYKTCSAGHRAIHYHSPT